MIDRFGLYAILTDPVLGYETCADAVLSAEIKYLQLRMKQEDKETILKQAEVISKMCKGTKTNFIINDDPEIAMAVDADGVHVGQNDMPLAQVRSLWNNSDKIYGLSTHNEQQAKAAQALHPDYIGVGPVFPTPTKTIPDPTVGLKHMREIICKSPLTTVAIGGINAENLKDVLDAGAVNFCAVRAIMQSSEPRKAIRRLMEIWKRSQEKGSKAG